MQTETMFNQINPYYSEKVGIEICTDSDMSENSRALINKATFNPDLKFESWCAIGTNQQLAYSTHGIFRYFGKFPSAIATHLINQYTKNGELVIDPMSGSGTTALEALILQRKCIANDINPFSSLLAKVKTTFIERELLNNELNFIVKEYKPLSISEYYFEPVALPNYNHWFLPETTDSLRGLKYVINKIDNSDIRDFYTIIFASVVRQVSKATTQQGRLFLDIDTATPDALEIFEKKARKYIPEVSSLPCPNNTIVINKDLRDFLFTQYKNKAQLVILHPPYFNSYKYSSINSLETGWLGFDRLDYRKNEIKEFFKVGKPEKVETYVDDMEVALNSALSLLSFGGTLALMIGDSIIKGTYLPVTQMLIDRVDLNKYIIEKIVVRVPKYTEATWVASQRRDSDSIGVTLNDFIIIFRKVG